MSGSDDGPPNPLADPEFVAGLRPIPTGRPGEAPDWPAADLHGVGPDGSPVAVVLAEADRPVLLVFLTTDCDGCESFWRGLADGADPTLARVEPVVVTRGPDDVPSAEVAARGAGFGGRVVMGDGPWADYRVTGYPFLVLVDPASRRILSEAVGFAWPDVATVVRSGLDR